MSFRRRFMSKGRSNTLYSTNISREDEDEPDQELPIYSPSPNYFPPSDSGLDGGEGEGSVRSLPSIPGSSTPSVRGRDSLRFDGGGGGGVASPGEGNLAHIPQRYVYYRIYNPSGAVPSKTSSYANDPHLGRILATLVPPPHTVLSLKRCISNTEGLAMTGVPELYKDIMSASPEQEGFVNLFAADALGNTPERAVALVFKDAPQPPPQPEQSQPQRPQPLLHRPLSTSTSTSTSTRTTTVQERPESMATQQPQSRLQRALSTQTPMPTPIQQDRPEPMVTVPRQYLKFSRRIRAKHSSKASQQNSKYLDHQESEIFWTDGKSHREVFAGGSGGGRSAAPRFKVYKAVNDSGVEGWILKSSVEFID